MEFDGLIYILICLHCSWLFWIDMLMCKCKNVTFTVGTSRYSLKKKKTRLFLLYFPSETLICVLHVTINYSLIVCIKIYTFVNTYNRLWYIFDRINSVHLLLRSRTCAVRLRNIKTNIYLIQSEFSPQCRICLLK